jgi:5-formyltetrahydrofolate cyclo-ligase
VSETRFNPDGSGASSGALKKAKRAVRREVLVLRDAIEPAERARLGALAADRIMALPEVAGASTVMAFWSFGSELPMAPVIGRLQAAGIRVALPRIAGGALEVVEHTAGGPTTETGFGAREPVGPPMAPSLVDVVLTPAVAFDPEGRRIGYGGGFYDRFFPRTRRDAFRAGVAFDVQVVPGPLPCGSFDQRVQAVVTPTRVIRCPPA